MAARRTICMAPSNTLSSADASKFGSTVAELPIILDYLQQTSGLVWKTADNPTQADWWDRTGAEREYANMLAQRHPTKLKVADVLKRKPHRPDISTYKGRYLRVLPGGAVVLKRSGERNEIYEIKPHSFSGEADGIQKLRDVHLSYRSFGIAGIYTSGTWYPQEIPPVRRLRFPTTVWAKNHIDYFMTLLYRLEGLRVIDIWLEVERVKAGLLLYRICVEVEGDGQRWTKDMMEVGANFVVRTFFRCLTVDATKEVQTAATTFAASLVPIGHTPPRIIASLDPQKVLTIKLSAVEIVDELRPMLSNIRHAMYSRFYGLPGEEYLLCCDEVYFTAVIRGPGIRQAERTKALLSISRRPPIFAGTAAGGISILPVVALTASEIAWCAMTAPGSVALASLVFPMSVKQMIEWARENPKGVLILAGTALIVTALVAVTVLTGGAAAPLTAEAGAVVLEGGALAAVEGGAASAAIAVETGVAAGNIGGPVLGMEAGLMAASSGTVVAGETTVTLASAAGPVAGQSLAQWAAANPAVVAAARPLVSKLLRDALVSAAVKKAIPVAASALVLGVTVNSAYATTRDSAAGTSLSASILDLNAPVIGNSAVGRLFLIPARKGQFGTKLYDQFDYAKFARDPQSTASLNPATDRARYLGRLRVD